MFMTFLIHNNNSNNCHHNLRHRLSRQIKQVQAEQSSDQQFWQPINFTFTSKTDIPLFFFKVKIVNRLTLDFELGFAIKFYTLFLLGFIDKMVDEENNWQIKQQWQ